MNSSINYRSIIILLACILLIGLRVKAQLPQSNLVYMNHAFNSQFPSDSLYNYDPSLPVSATNPSLNSIKLPHNNVGLAIGPVLGSGGGSGALTYYTSVDGKYWYYNAATNAWVNTGHTYGPTTNCNFAAGGGFIYGMRGFGNAPNVYKYDGTGNATYVATVQSPLPFDLVADCEGNFYVISLIGPMWSMTKYSSSGVIVQGYSVSNPSNYFPSGGMALIGNNLYVDDNTSKGIAHATITGTNVVFNSVSAPVPYIVAGFSVSDMATCPASLSALPTVSITASDTVICNGSSVTFAGQTTNTNGNVQYQWLVNGAAVPGAHDSTFTYSPADNDVVTLQLTGNGGCAAITVISPAIIIQVLQQVALSIEMPEAACAGEVVAVNITTPASVTYQWNFSGATVVSGSDAGPYELRWDAAGTYTVSVQAGEEGCSAVATDSIVIHSLPVLSLSTGQNSVCIGDTIRLTAITDSGSVVQWLPGKNYTLTNMQSNQAFAVLLQNSEIPAKVTDVNGCNASDNIHIDARNCCQLMMPNAFSPNNDNKNDIFSPFPAGHNKIMSFRIFNRWGQVVYSAFNGSAGWDGTFKGNMEDPGTYFYMISYLCDGSEETFSKNGDLTLIR